MMEVYAGFLAFTDHETGRLLDAINEMGIGDNTLIIYGLVTTVPARRRLRWNAQ